MELRVVRVPIVNREKCTELYKGFNNITESMICAGLDKGEKDGCQVSIQFTNFMNGRNNTKIYFRGILEDLWLSEER